MCIYEQSVPSIMYQQWPKTSDKTQLFKENSHTVEDRSETNHGIRDYKVCNLLDLEITEQHRGQINFLALEEAEKNIIK